MSSRSILRTSTAGIAYFGIVFTAGFVLGVLRHFALLPTIGELPAVLLELPIMLALSWFVCRWMVAHFAVPDAIGHRSLMGSMAFAILMAAEFAIPAVAFGRSLPDHLAYYYELPALIGLAGQLAFAAFPVLQMVISSPAQR